MKRSSPWHTARPFTFVTSLIPVFIHMLAMGAHGQQSHGRRYNYNSYNNYNNYNQPPPLPKDLIDKDNMYEDSTQFLDPEFVVTETNVTSRAGDEAVLPCAVRHLGTRKVVWRRLFSEGEPMVLTVGDFVWSQRERTQVLHTVEEGFVSHWNLRLQDVKLADQGTYECQITDKEVVRWHVHLQVKPKIIFNPTVHLSGSQYVDSGERIVLTCNATGGEHIPEDIDWFKDGTKLGMREDKPFLELTKHMSIETGSLISQLTVQQAREADSGSYICRSSDRKIDSIKVTVLIAPDDPTNVKRGTGSLASQEDDVTGSVSRAKSSLSVVLTSLILGLLPWLPQKKLVFS